jgi:hypothetical protein
LVTHKRTNGELMRIRWWLTACANVLIVAGCREQPTTVQGLVTLDGKPLAIHQHMRGTIVFQPTRSDGTTLNGIIDAAGRYELTSGSSFAVAPGNYSVTVSAVELVTPDETHPQSSGRRITPAKYASAADSGFRVEVLPGVNRVNLAMTSDTVPPATADGDDAPPQETHQAERKHADQDAAGAH